MPKLYHHGWFEGADPRKIQEESQRGRHMGQENGTLLPMVEPGRTEYLGAEEVFRQEDA